MTFGRGCHLQLLLMCRKISGVPVDDDVRDDSRRPRSLERAEAMASGSQLSDAYQRPRDLHLGPPRASQKGATGCCQASW